MTGETNVSRRNVVKGIAWATPAVMVATALPAYAASPGCLTVTIAQDGQWSGWSWAFTWEEPFRISRVLTLKVTFKVRPGCTVVLKAIPPSALALTRPGTTYAASITAGLPITARTLTSDYTVTIKATVYSTGTWPNQAALTYGFEGASASQIITRTATTGLVNP